jgi:glycosyltransferase involved in cell wall biosynthesis
MSTNADLAPPGAHRMTDDRPTSLSVFFPAFNEEGNLTKLIEQTIAVVSSLVENFEIIIVNDGSTDGTAEVADELAAKHAEVRALHQENQGYGGALMSGFNAASKEAVFFSDADNQFDLGDIARFWEHLRDHEAVVGFRMPRQDPPWRTLNGFLWGRLVCLIFRIRIKDLDCAFKMFSKSAITDIKLRCRSQTISAELMVRLDRKGVRWKQLGVRHFQRTYGEQSGNNFRVILKAFRDLFGLYRMLRRESRQVPNAQHP